MADSSVSRFGCYTIIWDTTGPPGAETVPMLWRCGRVLDQGPACLRALACGSHGRGLEDPSWSGAASPARRREHVTLTSRDPGIRGYSTGRGTTW
jgi:hypothetical protein